MSVTSDSAVPVIVAEAVVSMLAASSADDEFLTRITPQRSYADWDLVLEDECLHVDVVAVTTEQAVELASRDTLRYNQPIDIGVRQRFTSDKQIDTTGRVDIAEVDRLVKLVQQIHERFAPQRLTDFADVVGVDSAWLETRILANPILKMLRENRQFTGIVRVVFTYDKPLAQPIA